MCVCVYACAHSSCDIYIHICKCMYEYNIALTIKEMQALMLFGINLLVQRVKSFFLLDTRNYPCMYHHSRTLGKYAAGVHVYTVDNVFC